MTEITMIKELSGQHVGLRVRLQNPEGGYIEGTLARISATITSPYGTHVEYEVELDEFKMTFDSKDRIKFWMVGIDGAKVIDE